MAERAGKEAHGMEITILDAWSIFGLGRERRCRASTAAATPACRCPMEATTSVFSTMTRAKDWNNGWRFFAPGEACFLPETGRG